MTGESEIRMKLADGFVASLAVSARISSLLQLPDWYD
jgi:hypothetical protein